jgi:hypothetical protein
MIIRGSKRPVEALPHVEGNSDLERHGLPISLCIAGTAVMMNVFAAMLSLIALSVS